MDTSIMEEKTMGGAENVSLNDSLLLRGAGGFGGYNNGHVGVDGPVFQHAVDAINQSTENQADCTREVIGLQVASSQQAFENLTRANEFNLINKSIVDAEFRSNDRQRDSDREAAANFRSISEKLAAIEKQQAIDTGDLKAEAAAIKATLAANKEISELNAQLTALKTQVACGCVTGCSTPCS